MHRLRDDPVTRRALAQRGLADALVLGLPDRRRAILGLRLDRHRSLFSESDVALLRTLVPVLDGLLTSVPDVGTGATLTAQETRILHLVAIGMSNADVAARICVAPSTVRKHLEHAFRKLGVTNRLAAVRALDGIVRPEALPADQDKEFA